MAGLRRLFFRLLTAFRIRRADHELTREIDAHLTLLEDAFLARGLGADEARLRARRALGGVDQTKEGHRDARSFRWIDDGCRDVGYAWRSLSRTPAFTTAAVLTLAVGIGVTTAILSVVDTVLLQPLPFEDADRLVKIVEQNRPRDMPRMNGDEFLQWRERTKTLSGLATVSLNPQVLLKTREGAVRVSGGGTSPNYFDVLGMKAALGRTLQESDATHPDVVVLSFDTWQRHFHRDPAAVGSTVELRSTGLIGSTLLAGRLFTVVGVMLEGFADPAGPMDFYVPAVRSGGSPPSVGMLVGRLAGGVSMSDALREANAIGEAVRPPRPASAPRLSGPRFGVESLKDDIVAGLRPALRVFLAAVAVVLLIVCANVANLLLARGTARQREIAVRLAIGASRGRIARQVLAECLVLAVAGGALGAALGAAGVALVKRLAAVEAPGVFRLAFGSTLLPRANEVGVDLRVLGIALGLAVATSVTFGLLPALHLSRTPQAPAMSGRGGIGSRRHTRFRMALVVAQLVMATVLLVGAGLLAHSFMNLARVEKGYDPANVLAFQLVLPGEYSTVRKTTAIETLLDRLRSMPNVTAGGFSYAGVLVGVEDTWGSFVPAGAQMEDVSEPNRPRIKSVSRGYLDAVGVQLLDGRLFDERDAANAPPVIVVNRAVARRYFGGSSALGERMSWYYGSHVPASLEIVGVVEDIRQGALDREPYPEIFIDYRQLLAIQQGWGASKATQEHLALGFLSFAVRTTDDPTASIPIVRAAINAVDPNAGIDAIIPMTHLVASSLARQRFYAVMLGAFAAVSGLLAVIGVYGVLAYAVEERTQEIGVRMALGARRGQVLRLVLHKAMLLAGAGIAIGLAGAAASATYLRSLLFGLEPIDPATFALVGGAFAAVAAVASYLPAHRATLVDPMITLRID